MTHELSKVKRQRYFPKDWERRARVQEALYQQKMNVTDLCAALQIDRSHGYVSSLIWGTQRSTKWEKRIAEVLGREWLDLFGRRPVESERRVAA